MKKIILIVVAAIIVGSLVECALRPEIRYPSGKDTKESFGDGTYQIGTIHAPTGYYDILDNSEYNNTIIPYVEQFHKTKEKAYVIGNETRNYEQDGVSTTYTYDIYAVIDVKTNHLTLCIIPSSPSAPDMWIADLDVMIENGDVLLVNQLTDFSAADQAVFEGFDHS